jgi:hypothetical protein
MSQPPIAQQFACKLILASISVKPNVKIILKIRHQAIEFFNI